MTHWKPQNWKEAFTVECWEIVPKSQLDVIENACSTTDDCYYRCAQLYVKFYPKASWRDLSKRMYHSGAKSSSLDAIRPYLPPKGMTEESFAI